MVSVFLAGSIGVGKTFTVDEIIKFMVNDKNLKIIKKIYPNLLKHFKKSCKLTESPSPVILSRYYNALKAIKTNYFKLFQWIMGLFFALLMLGKGGSEFVLLLLFFTFVIIWVFNKLRGGSKLTPKDVCFDTQMYFLCKKRKHLRIAANGSNNDKLVMFDKSWFEDPLFPKLQLKMGYMTQSQYDIYFELFKELSKDGYVNKKDSIYIYLKASPETCFLRLQNRIRDNKFKGFDTSNEELITLSYLKELRSIYDKWEVQMKRNLKDRFIVIDNGDYNGILKKVLNVINDKVS